MKIRGINKMRNYKSLTESQRKALLNFPVYTSLLAAKDRKLEEKERITAIQFAHTKVFTCDPLLADFCRESDSVFESNLGLIEALLPQDARKRDALIRKELLNLETILLKMGKDYSYLLHQSMRTFREHIQKANHSVIEDFILPIAIPGLTD